MIDIKDLGWVLLCFVCILTGMYVESSWGKNRDSYVGFGYIRKCFKIYTWNILQWINKRVLKTYPSNHDCARCEDCGRNVHDFDVSDDLWVKVYGSDSGVLCYDCFCERARVKGLPSNYKCEPL